MSRPLCTSISAADAASVGEKKASHAIRAACVYRKSRYKRNEKKTKLDRLKARLVRVLMLLTKNAACLAATNASFGVLYW